MNKNSILYMTIFTFIVTVAIVVPLAIADEATRPFVQANRQFAQGKAVLLALGNDITGKTQTEVLDIYKKIERKAYKDGKLSPVPEADALARDMNEDLLYFATVDGVERVARKARGNGLWAGITVVLGYEPSTDLFSGLSILAQVETPGLGARIEEQWFLDQFKHETASKPLVISLIGTGEGDKNKGNSSVDSISGATLTSGFVRDIINKGIVTLKTELKGGAQ